MPQNIALKKIIKQTRTNDLVQRKVQKVEKIQKSKCSKWRLPVVQFYHHANYILTEIELQSKLNRGKFYCTVKISTNIHFI